MGRSSFTESKIGIAILGSVTPMKTLKSEEKLNKFWNHPPLYWVQLLRWTYAVGLSPLKVISYGTSIRLQTCKLRQGLQLGIISLHIAFLASTFRNAVACENFITPVARLLVHLGDMTKYTSLSYVIWNRREAIEGVLNNSLFDRLRYSKVSLLGKVWIWLIVLGYPLLSYYVFIRIDMTNFDMSETFYQVSDPFRNCLEDSSSGTSSKLSTLELITAIVWRIVFSLHMAYVIWADGFLLAIVGSHGEFVDEAVVELQKAENADNVKSTEQTLSYIYNLQATIRNMNYASEIATSGWFFANLPFHIIRGIPLATSADKGILMFVLSRAYTVQFYMAVAVSAFKSNKVTNAVRSWVSKVKRHQIHKLPELHLLYTEANASQDFALSLFGLGSLNPTLFFSTVSATVTYTILNYQFNLYKSV